MEAKNLRVKKLIIDTPDFDPHPERSKNNHTWRQVLVIKMMDDEGNEYDWMPRWSEVKQINNARMTTEEANKEIAKRFHLRQEGIKENKE